MRQPMTRRDRVLIGALLAAVIGMAGSLAWPHLRPLPVDPDIDAYTRGDFPNGMAVTADRMLHRAEREAMPANRREALLQMAADLYHRAGRTEDARRAMRAELDLHRQGPNPHRRLLARLAEMLIAAPPASTRAGLAERRELYAETVRRHALHGGPDTVVPPPTGLIADITAFLKANTDALSESERAALTREIRLLWERRVGDWRVYPTDWELVELARAVAADGEPERAASIMDRALGLPPALDVGAREARQVLMREAIEYRYPNPCDTRRLDALSAQLDWGRPVEWNLKHSLIGGYATAHRYEDAIRCAERMAEMETRGAASNDRWNAWVQLTHLVELHRAAGDEAAAREIERRAYIQYPDVVCAIGS